jgi:hypothetical protein
MGLVDKIKGLLGQATEKTRPLLKQDTETAEPPPQQPTETAEPPPQQATEKAEPPLQQATGAAPARALSDAERAAAAAESAAAYRNMWPSRRRCRMPSGRPPRSLLRRIRIGRTSTYRPLVRKDSEHAKRSWTHKPGLGGPAPTEAWCSNVAIVLI